MYKRLFRCFSRTNLPKWKTDLQESERQRQLLSQHWGAELERSMAFQVRAEQAEAEIETIRPQLELTRVYFRQERDLADMLFAERDNLRAALNNIRELTDEWEAGECQPLCMRINCGSCALAHAGRRVRRFIPKENS